MSQVCPSSSHQLVAAAIAFHKARRKFPKDFGCQSVEKSTKPEENSSISNAMPRRQHLLDSTLPRGDSIRRPVVCKYCSCHKCIRNEAINNSKNREACDNRDLDETEKSNSSTKIVDFKISNYFNSCDTSSKMTDCTPTKDERYCRNIAICKKHCHPQEKCFDESRANKDSVKSFNTCINTKNVPCKCKNKMSLLRDTSTKIHDWQSGDHERPQKVCSETMEPKSNDRPFLPFAEYYSETSSSRFRENHHRTHRRSHHSCHCCCHHSCQRRISKTNTSPGELMSVKSSLLLDPWEGKTQEKKCFNEKSDSINAQIPERGCCSKDSGTISTLREVDDEEYDENICVLDHKDSMSILVEKYNTDKNRGNKGMECLVDTTIKDECNHSLSSDMNDQKKDSMSDEVCVYHRCFRSATYKSTQNQTFRENNCARLSNLKARLIKAGMRCSSKGAWGETFHC